MAHHLENELRNPQRSVDQMRQETAELDDWQEELETKPTDADEQMEPQQQYVMELDEDDIKAILLNLAT